MEDKFRAETFALEAEDVIAARLLRVFFGFEKGQAGHYVDIGAYQPIHASNTWLFYKRGWSGLLVDANPDAIAALKEVRPRDTVVNSGAGETPGVLCYTIMSDPLVNGFYGEKHRHGLERAGYKYVGWREVPVRPIREIVEEHCPWDIDFLSVDIEGFEMPVWRNWDFVSKRPRVICTEIHSRSIQDVIKTDQAQKLMSEGYLFISRLWHSSFFIDGKKVDKWP